MANDVTKLPKWARDEVYALSRQVKELQALVAALTSSSKDTTNTWWVENSRLGSVHSLPNNVSIRFSTASGEVLEARLMGGQLRVSTDMGYLLVQPLAQNVVYVLPGPRGGGDDV